MPCARSSPFHVSIAATANRLRLRQGRPADFKLLQQPPCVVHISVIRRHLVIPIRRTRWYGLQIVGVFSGVRAVLIVAGVALCLTGRVAGSSQDADQCRRRLYQATRNLTAAVLKERTSCHRQRMAGQLPAATQCNDPTRSPASSINARRRLAKATRACEATTTPSDLNYVACPAPCQALTIADFTEVAACMTCVAEAAAYDVAQAVYGEPPTPASFAAQGCQRSIARGAMRYWWRRFTAQLACRIDSSTDPSQCSGGNIDAVLTRARDDLDAAVARCTADTLSALDSCARTVPLEQECVRSVVGNTTDMLHNAVLPADDAPFTAAPCPATGEPFVDCWPTSGMSIGLPYLQLIPDQRETRFSLEAFCSAGYLEAGDDALPDVVCTSLEKGLRVYKNRGEFRFEDVTTRVGLGSQRRGNGLMSLSLADLDGDGQQDLLGAELPPTFAADLRDAYVFGLPFRSAFEVTLRAFRNEAGVFRDVTNEWGFGPHHYPSFALFSTKLADVNHDGRLDVAFKQFPVRGAVPPLLFVSHADGTWHESAAEYFGPGVVGNAFALGWTDINQDGEPDFMLINSAFGDGGGSNPPMLLLRRNGGVYEQEAIGPHLSNAVAMGAAAIDLDADGWMELVITDIGRNVFLKRAGDGLWSDHSPAMGLTHLFNVSGDPTSGAAVAFTAAFIPVQGKLGAFFSAGTDGSNVGRPYIKLFTVEENGFVERSELIAGLAQHNGEGVAQADFDGDGCPDLLVAGHSWFDPAGGEWVDDEPLLVWNRSSPGQCLSLGFRTTSGNPYAIGTIVTVESGGTTRTQALYGLGSQNGDDEARVFFPVAAAEHARVHIRWPDGTRQAAELLPGRHTLHQP